MIRTIRGKYMMYDAGSVVVETSSGIGFRISVSDTSRILTMKEGDELLVYTFLQVKEDSMSLYGFADPDELHLFEQLITVNGVGPKAGLAIMSLGTPNQIKAAIAGKDAAAVAQAQGVGKKTAERVILELCDKVSVIPVDGADNYAPVVAAAFSDERAEAVVALTSLGYSKKEAESAISAVTDDGLSAEAYIKKALQYLM